MAFEIGKPHDLKGRLVRCGQHDARRGAGIERLLGGLMRLASVAAGAGSRLTAGQETVSGTSMRLLSAKRAWGRASPPARVSQLL